MEALPVGAAVSWRAKGTWRGLRSLQDPWFCPDNVAQTPCRSLQGFRNVALEPSMPLEGDVRPGVAVSQGCTAELLLPCLYLTRVLCEEEVGIKGTLLEALLKRLGSALSRKRDFVLCSRWHSHTGEDY